MSIPILANMQAFTIAYSESDFFGKLIILSLILLSVICWMVLSYKIWQIKKVKKISSIFQIAVEKNKEHILQLELSELPKPIHPKIPHPYAQIFQALKQKTVETLNKKIYFIEQSSKDRKEHGIYLSNADLDLLDSYLCSTIAGQNKVLEKDLFVLSTIVTLAPFLGLLGTVWGILVTFSELHAGGSVGSSTAMLGGLSTALSTTVLGLIIAIPALVAYNYLKNSLKSFSSDMEDFLNSLLSTIELQYRKVDIS